jgi:diaminopimelate decarboxylase
VKAYSPPQRPPGFTYQSDPRRISKLLRSLHADAVPVARLAERFGTPLYVYSASTIRQRYRQFDEAFGNCAHTLCYSVKANSNLSILRMLAGMKAGFDIVSGGELQRVIDVAPKAASKVVFSGVGKLAEEIDQALAANILLFNVESASELELLAARASQLRKRASFAIRVNPQVAAKTHPYISTGLREHKFGVPWQDAMELYRRGARERWLTAAGVSVHIGSQITDADPFRQSSERIAALVRSLKAGGFDIRFVDLGGGLGISYNGSPATDFARQIRSYAKAIKQPLKPLGVHLLLEPGRAIIAPAGVLVTRVVYGKQNGSKRFVVVDAAMNDLLRPALYNAFHEIVPVILKAGHAKLNNDKVKVDIVGPVCETGDFFAHDREIRSVEEGDLLAILDAGAYGMALASNYNTRPRAAEVLVDGNGARLIRRREAIADLLAPERI